MLRSKLFVMSVIAGLCCGTAVAQQSSGSGRLRTIASARQTRATASGNNWRSNKLVSAALANPQRVTTTRQMLGATDGKESGAIIAVLRKQSAAAQAMLVPAVRPTSPNRSGALLSGNTAQPLLSRSSTQPVGAGQAMYAPGTGSSGTTPSTATSAPPTMQQASRGTAPGRVHQVQQKPGSRIIPSQACRVGIGSVDGQNSGVWFSPISGPEGTFVLQGCGFGTTVGEVYLTGLHYATVPLGGFTRSVSRSPFNRNRVTFQVAPNQWNDRQIVAQIDPNASGFYDTNNVTLVVKTTGGQLYQATGFNFSAARATQNLTGILNPQMGSGIQLAKVTDSVGGTVIPLPESPSVSFLQNHTIGVMRNLISWTLSTEASFPGSTDSYQFKMSPGFQIDPQSGVQLYTTTNTNAANACQSVSGNFSTNGNWSVSYTSTTSFDITWQEEACLPGSKGGNPLDFGSVSAYALEITVLGPRGISPWANGN
ncbi:MAG TPA: hypothetical protein VF447_02975 [Terriglobales bacterium]